ncbi:MAG TPA: hypothetical protein VGC07_05950 [Granulicella sp.]
MPSTPDWTKRAENQYENEQREIRQTGRIGTSISVFAFIGASIVLGVIQLVRWGLEGKSLLPTRLDIYWFAGVAIWIVILPPVFERWDEARKLRAQRLIRLEIKLDALLDRHEHVDSQITDLRHEIWEARSRR